jgi:hypothetical protein
MWGQLQQGLQTAGTPLDQTARDSEEESEEEEAGDMEQSQKPVSKRSFVRRCIFA